MQDTFLRAWRYRESVREGLSLRPWLYRIATNSCLDAIARDPRRTALAAASERETPGTPATAQPAEVAWLQPFPDTLLEPVAPRDSEPDAVVIDPRDDRDRVPDRDPAPQPAAAGRADPARRARLVREGDRRASRAERRGREQRAAAGARHRARADSAAGPRGRPVPAPRPRKPSASCCASTSKPPSSRTFHCSCR